MDWHNTLKTIEKEDEETCLTHCYGYAIQGDWLNFDAVLKADLSWNPLIYSIPQELLKFLLNSTNNVLPTSDNLRRWGKTVVDLKCCLRGFSNPILKHILNGCSMALKQGRYTWRHDSTMGSPFTRVPFARATRLKILNVKYFQFTRHQPIYPSRAKANASIPRSFCCFVGEVGGRGWLMPCGSEPGKAFWLSPWLKFS